MRRSLLSILLIASGVVLSADHSRGQYRPIPPGLHEGEKRISAPLDRPVVSHGKNIDRAQLHREADELAKLCTAIPAQVEQVNQGQIPRDLGDQLKRIEKLAKHLRSEISQ